MNTGAEMASEPWGLGATLALSFAVMVAFLIITTTVLLGAAFLDYRADTGVDFTNLVEGTLRSGPATSLAVWSSVCLCLCLIAFFVVIRRRFTVRRYLAIRPFSLRAGATWLGAFMLLSACFAGVIQVLGIPEPEFITEMNERTRQWPLTWIEIVLLIPFFEEILFRGFMFRGIQHSGLGNYGAILATAMTWAGAHVFQYDPLLVIMLFMEGVVLGAARLRSESVLLPFALHAAANLAAMILAVGGAGR